ncbi:glycoside hydrolase domain-containing protein [Paenibacillus flagellatus]|uniref:Rv2525c-like glycoside hydrolase-like domain-containing protein n=1 Tax=Paenibacillus flagellatus TaxID=2211139 RepID=A0A2V5K067_9BACL|nr:glycoside hydrolase domain-containing protein [Paenibacillus flagellatus]PYI52559.1 hypothetical protein DLM86_20515 [Paenibacillus flagellatus]
MTKGLDCATPLSAAKAAAFRADGYEFACRYLVPSGWKRLTREEAEAISEAGLHIVSVFETTADRALGGRAAGLADGAAAARTAQAIGQPEGSAIYFAVDFDASATQMAAVIDYIRAASEATPAYATGVYGSYAVIEAVRRAGVCSRYWQTYAWSRGRKADGIHLYQYRNDIDVNGVGIDMNESYGNEGWWNTMGYPLKAEDANEIIARFLSHEFNLASDEDKRRRNELANELRKASGQAVQPYAPNGG